MEFTKPQLEAISHQDGNLQIVACAGSGKTEVVARRIVSLLKSGAKSGLTPRNIVAFTFTDKAAAELKDRILTMRRRIRGRSWNGRNVCWDNTFLLFRFADC